ncbi:MAG TPA: hypothetical protein VMS89_01060 [Methanoregulaceae archaeon]|nr:hypothetical protein [Methanoregulaceae archaeon]
MAIFTIVLILSASGPAMAAQITVVTSASVQGNFQDQSSLAMQQGDGTIGASEDTMAVSGTTTYEKSQTIDTSPKSVAGDNLHTDRIIEFNATPGTGGRMTSSEEVLVATETSGSSTDPTCGLGGGDPGAASAGATNSIIRAGSTLDVTEVSAHTTSDARVVTESPGTPVSLDYSIAAQGINQTPGDVTTGAVGSATAYVDANIQGGDVNSTSPDGTLEYHDITSVEGLFDLAKSVSYSSAPK